MADYSNVRNLYYLGLLNLVLYSLYKIDLIRKYLYPIYEYEIFVGMPVITAIGIATGFGIFLAYRYRKIG